MWEEKEKGKFSGEGKQRLLSVVAVKSLLSSPENKYLLWCRLFKTERRYLLHHSFSYASVLSSEQINVGMPRSIFVF